MPGTRLADVLVPEVWSEYLNQAILKHSQLLQSGILYVNPYLTQLANGGGQLIEMPRFNGLTGDAEDGGKGYDGVALTPDKITTGKEIATKIFRAKAWDASDFSAMLSGADPMGAIAAQVAGFWQKQQQKALIASLSGVFGALGETHTLDISTKEIDANATVDAMQLLGDYSDSVTAIVMHSATHAKLVKDKFIQYETVDDKSSTISFYLGKRVIIDDTMPVSAGVYETYLFAPSSISYANVAVKTPIEQDRDTLSGVDVLVSRLGWIMHPNRMSIEQVNPTNEKLAETASWKKVGENKEIRIIRMKHKIGA